jgi:uncharacterized membrane protein
VAQSLQRSPILNVFPRLVPMTPLLAIAFVLGIVAGLRTFTAPAILLLARGPRVAGIIVAILAIGELIADQLPTMGSRTKPGPLIGRCISGAFCGWFVAGIPGAVLGIIGALIGTFGGHALRLKAIARIGTVPAALLEDAVAIGVAVLAVLQLTRPA